MTSTAASALNLQLGRGNVMHVRHRPVFNRFIYPVFCLRICISRLEAVKQQGSWLLGFNRVRPIAFFERDHGDRNTELRTWLSQKLAGAGVQIPDGDIWLQTFPRVFGYVFNPVSFWYMHDQQGELKAILAEVNNTFGEHHQYLLTAQGNQAIDADTSLVCRKAFHVSPFCEIRGFYQFRYLGNHPHHVMSIDYFMDEEPFQPLIATKISYRTLAPTQWNMLKALVNMPLLTFGIVFRIHWQALLLWIKRVPYIPKPQASPHSLTQNQQEYGNDEQ